MPINSLVIDGTLIKKSVKVFENAKTRTGTFKVASYRNYKKAGEMVREDQTYDVKAFKETMEGIEAAPDRAHLVIQGRLNQETWDYQGKLCSKLIIIAEKIIIFGATEETAAAPGTKDNEDMPF